MAKTKKFKLDEPTIDLQAVMVPRGEIARAALSDEREASDSLTFVRALEIKTKEQYAFAGNALKEVAVRHDQIKKKRDGWTKPLESVVEDIKGTFDPVIKAFSAMESILKEKIGAYAIACAEQKSALVRLASADYAGGNVDGAGALVEKAKAMDVPELEGIGVKPRWCGELVDGNALIDAVLAGKLGREYLLPNIRQCEATTEAQQADPGIPGWRAYVSASVRTSRKG